MKIVFPRPLVPMIKMKSDKAKPFYPFTQATKMALALLNS